MSRQARSPAEQCRMGKAIGGACRNARKQLNMTQAEVAARAGMSMEFYSRIERGQALPSVCTLAALAEALDLSTDAMLGRRRKRDTRRPANSVLTAYPRRILRVLPLLQRATPGTLKLIIILLNTLNRRSSARTGELC